MDHKLDFSPRVSALSGTSQQETNRRRARYWRYLAAAAILFSATVLTARYWLQDLGSSLVYQGRIQVSQAILIENFDPNYLLFERTEQLLREGWAKFVFVIAQEGHIPGRAFSVSEGFIQVMARVAGMAPPEIITFREIEPISLNAALQVRDFLRKRNIQSVIVVTSGFRSRRSYLIWDSILRPAGIRVSCVPVFGSRTTVNWHKSWHGWQEVTLELLKLAYYRLYALHKIPRLAGLGMPRAHEIEFFSPFIP
jgi:uncharacterized SAM-binding protein YcdF (DUF218 family)